MFEANNADLAGRALISSSAHCDSPRPAGCPHVDVLLFVETALHHALREISPGGVPLSSDSWLPPAIVAQLQAALDRVQRAIVCGRLQ